MRSLVLSLYILGAGSAFDKIWGQAKMGPTTQGPQDHIELEVEKYSLHMPSKVHLEGPSGDHPQAQLPEGWGKHSHPHPGEKVIAM